MIIKPYRILNQEWDLFRERTKKSSSELGSLDRVILKLARPLAPLVHNLPKKLAIAGMLSIFGFTGLETVRGVYQKIHESRSGKLAEVVEFYDGEAGVSGIDSDRYSETFKRIPIDLEGYRGASSTIKDTNDIRRISDGWLGFDEVKFMLDDYSEGGK